MHFKQVMCRMNFDCVLKKFAYYFQLKLKRSGVLRPKRIDHNHDACTAKYPAIK